MCVYTVYSCAGLPYLVKQGYFHGAPFAKTVFFNLQGQIFLRFGIVTAI